jgi:hypothetical protein
MKVQITDHALVRWLERHHGIDMEWFRERLAEKAQPYVDVKAKHANVDGVWFVFHDERLATVVPDKPALASLHKNDTGGANGAGRYGEQLPWQARKRRRSHK